MILDLLCGVLESLEKARGAKAKNSILRDASSCSDLKVALGEFFRWTMDPFITRGADVKPDELISSTSIMMHDSYNQTQWWTQWLMLLSDLNERKLTGNKARAAVSEALEELPDHLQKWMIHMYRSSYRIGVGRSKIDKIWPGLLRSFNVQLAKEWDGKTIPADGVFCEKKFDGLRATFFLDPENPRSLSRNGKPLNNVKHIIDELMHSASGMVIDGELFNTDWKTSISKPRSSECGDTSSRFCAFDILPIGEFLQEKCILNLYGRQLILTAKVQGCLYTSFSKGIFCDTPVAVHKATTDYIFQGYEGSVIKPVYGMYTFDRKGWKKVKYFLSADLPVVALEKGRNRNSGRLGAFVVSDNGILTRVGTMSDTVRDAVWSDPEAYVGRIIEVKYQGKTPAGKLRFPTFLRFRDDKEE